MSSHFGDFLDHFLDNLKYIYLFYIILRLDIHIFNKLIIYLVIIIFIVLSFISLGCQQVKYESENKTKKGFLYSYTLSPLKYLCIDNNMINYFKYFGAGTLTIVVCILLLLI